MFSVPLILSTFALIFVAELPDKTALAALILATRFRARDVVLGAGLAFTVQTIIGVAAGSVLTLLPVLPIRVASGVGFLIFAYLAYRRSGENEAEKETAGIRGGTSAWLSSFLVIFAAEWGDLTQLATAALVAQTRQPISIGIGALLALWAVTLIAAYSGSKLGKLVKPKVLNQVGTVLFAVIGVVIIVTALL
jgi:putative Ca2+/H+ antiporter (TMEM165/GDT1 family)